MKSNDNFWKSTTAVTFAALAAAAAGCASYGPETEFGGYAVAGFAGTDQFYSREQALAAAPPVQFAPNGVAFEMVAYEGIAGARRAHRRYDAALAEKFDGACEPYVLAAAGETLMDVARLCDVPLAQLASYNSDAVGGAYIQTGQILQVPGAAFNGAPTALLNVGDALTTLYTIRAGDSLDLIAYRFNVAADAVAKLNPDVRWTDLKAGEKLVLPAPAYAPQAQVAAVYYDAPGAAWEGYAPPRRAGAGWWYGYGDQWRELPEGGSYIVAPKPYQWRPASLVAGAGGRAVEPGLGVSAAGARPRETIEVRRGDLPPGTAVTIYQGDNLQRLTPVRTVVADERGVVNETVRIPRRAGLGGVIFQATREDTGETIYSERVAVTSAPGDRQRGARRGDAAREAVDPYWSRETNDGWTADDWTAEDRASDEWRADEWAAEDEAYGGY